MGHGGHLVSRPDPEGGILSSLDGAFLALGVGLEPDPADWAQQREDAARFLAAVEPWATREYLPMLDDSTDTRKAFPPDVHARLSEIRRGVDPQGLFMAPEGGACVAALRKLRASGHLSADDTVVVFNTGTGFKYVETLSTLW